jgi:endonuclease/exonuclease/phosphatase family metal-dependent hydrolase
MVISMESFRITTYNIHKCRGLDRRVRPGRIAEVLKQIDADIIALQEVAGMDEASPERNQLRAIAEELGFDFRTGENRRLRGAAYGNAVLTRLAIISQHNHDITWRKSEPRGCLHVRIALKDKKPKAPRSLQIYNTHLGTGFFERRYQASKLLEILSDHPDPSSARIILGDFNEWTRGRASQLLSDRFYTAEPKQRLGRARTYPGVLPVLHLDHIYYDAQLELVNIKLHRTRLALVASDHLPLVADFHLQKSKSLRG